MNKCNNSFFSCWFWSYSLFKFKYETNNVCNSKFCGKWLKFKTNLLIHHGDFFLPTENILNCRPGVQEYFWSHARTMHETPHRRSSKTHYKPILLYFDYQHIHYTLYIRIHYTRSNTYYNIFIQIYDQRATQRIWLWHFLVFGLNFTLQALA